MCQEDATFVAALLPSILEVSSLVLELLIKLLNQPYILADGGCDRYSMAFVSRSDFRANC